MATKKTKLKMDNMCPSEMIAAQRYLDVSAVMMVALDKQGKITLINKAGQRVLGYKKNEIIGKDWFAKFIPSENRTEVKGVFKKLMAGKVKLVTQYDNPILIKGGELKMISWSNSLFKGKNGKIEGILSSGTDVTASREAREKLRKSEDLYKTVAEATPDCMKIVDLQGEITYANDSTVVNHRLDSKDKALGRSIFSIEPKIDCQKARRDFSKAKQGEIVNSEYKGVFSNGDHRYILRTYAPIIDKKGKVFEILIICRDITSIKESEKALERSEESYRTVVESASDLIFMIDRAGRVVSVNYATEQTLGKTRDKMIGQNISSLFPQNPSAEYQRAVKEVFKTGKGVQNLESVMPVGEKQYNLSTSLNPIKSKSGEIVAVLGVARDITKHKQVEHKLQESEERYRLLYETAGDAVMTLEPPSWKFTSGNPAIVKMFGVRDEKEFTSLGPWQVSPKYQPDGGLSSVGVKKNIAKAMRTGENFFEWKHKKVGGKDFFATVLLNRVKQKDKTFLQARVSDITEAKQATEALRKSEERFQDIALSSADWIWETDKDGKYVYSSGNVKKVLGYEPEYLIGKTPFDLMLPAEVKKVSAKFAKIAKAKKPIVDLENWNVTKDKKKRLVLTNGVPILDAQGKLQGYRGLDKDITKEREARNKLKLSEAKLESIIASIPDLVFTLNKKFEFTEYYAQPELRKTLYIEPGEFIGKKISNLFPKKFLSIALPPLRQALQKNKCTKFDYNLSIKGKSYFYAARVCPRLDASKKTIGVTVVSRDITDRVLAEEDLSKFKMAVSGATDQIIITDPDGKILYANEATTANTGYSQKEIIGTTPALWGRQMPAEFYEDLWQTIKEEKQPFQAEIKNKEKNGKIYDASLRISPILNEDGEVKFFLGMEKDITQEKEIDRAKTEFVSLASHQLRGPLTAINWYTEMLLGNPEEIDETTLGYLQEVYKGSRRMSVLVDVLLNISRIELGTFAIEPKLADVNKIAQDVLVAFKPVIKDRDLMVSTKFDPALPKMKVDKALLSVVFENLFSNAFKYTSSGGKIKIELRKKDDKMILKVVDSGCGIPRHQQTQIFKKLFRADNAITIDPSGHGLGLYIIKRILDKTGGEVWFTSEENKGSTFQVSLPLSGMSKQRGEKGIVLSHRISH